MASKNMDKSDKKEKNVLEIIHSVNSNNIDEVRSILLSGKAKVDEMDENGMTPLHHAAYKGLYDMCHLLLEYGADVNCDSHDHRYSALHFAALSGNAQIIKLFLAKGAKTYHTNSLNRTAAQMAGFVGNHVIVALINNFLPLSDIEYYTTPQGLEAEPKLPKEVAQPLYNLVMQTNLNPVYIAMTVEKSPILLENLGKAAKVLSLMCEKEVKRSENVNEVVSLKFHFLSYVLKSLEKELKKQNENGNKKVEKESDKLVFEMLIKKWLIGRPTDGFEEHLEFYVRDAVKSFPYVEMPLFLQVVRNMASKTGESWALDILHGVINGQKGFDDGISCSTCGTESKDSKKCSRCKSVQYCNRTCQRLHWNNHKKLCEKYLKEYNKRIEKEKGGDVKIEEKEGCKENKTETSDDCKENKTETSDDCKENKTETSDDCKENKTETSDDCKENKTETSDDCKENKTETSDDCKENKTETSDDCKENKTNK